VVRKVSLVLVITAGRVLADEHVRTRQPEEDPDGRHPDELLPLAIHRRGIGPAEDQSGHVDDIRRRRQDTGCTGARQATEPGPVQFLTMVGTQYPEVGTGQSRLPHVLGYFTGVQQTMAAQQKNFHQADVIPTKNLPNNPVYWPFVLSEILAIAIGAAGFLVRSSIVRALADLLGLVVIVTTRVISVQSKTRASTN